MMTSQNLYDKTCNSLRTYGNAFGSRSDRGWSWCNPNNPNGDRCAIARFISGNTDWEISNNLREELGLEASARWKTGYKLVHDITYAFDHMPEIINDKVSLEIFLQDLADIHNLTYTAPFAIRESRTAKPVIA